MSEFIPVGDTFDFEGKTYKAVKASGCDGCCMSDRNECIMFPCMFCEGTR